MQLKYAFILAGALLMAGCKSSPEKEKSVPRQRRITVQTNQVGALPGRAMATPVQALNGRIVSVNNQLRFVIVDFPNQKLPRLDQKLFVYRLEQKVAEIKVSGPYRGSTVAADILAGEAQFGDLVHDER